MKPFKLGVRPLKDRLVLSEDVKYLERLEAVAKTGGEFVLETEHKEWLKFCEALRDLEKG